MKGTVKDYFDVDQMYEKETKEEITKYELIQVAMHQSRPTTGFSDALAHDMKYVNNLLNKKRISEGEKYSLASIYEKTLAEYVYAVNTIESFEKFLITKYGKEKITKCMKEWRRICQKEGD